MNQFTNLRAPTGTPAQVRQQGPARARPRIGRAEFMRWLRKMHGWLGLWGALLGLLFGFSGIWLNHRAILKLPPVAQQRSEVHISLPDPAPADPQAMARWLQTALNVDRPPSLIRVEPAKPVPWAEKSRDAATPPLMQPAHWSFLFNGPDFNITADTWAGNRSINVRRQDNGVIATLMSLHKGIGMSAPWILLVDTLAGSLIFLSISGVILWVQTNRRRTIGMTIFAVSGAILLTLALLRL